MPRNEPTRKGERHGECTGAYYLIYGHIEQIAQAAAEGTCNAGAEAEIKRVPKTIAEHIAPGPLQAGPGAPTVTVDELLDYDAIIIGTPTCYGRVPLQMAAFRRRRSFGSVPSERWTRCGPPNRFSRAEAVARYCTGLRVMVGPGRACSTSPMTA